MFGLRPNSQWWPERPLNVTAPVNHRENGTLLKRSIGFTQEGSRVFAVQKIEKHGVSPCEWCRKSADTTLGHFHNGKGKQIDTVK